MGLIGLSAGQVGLALLGPILYLFLPRDATQSAVMPQYVVCLSVYL